MAVFPGAIPSFTGFTSSHTLAADNHAAQHNLEQGEIVQVATKIGTGASTPASGKVLRATGTGTSAWGQTDLTTDVTGVLPVANGGNGTTATTGSGSAVFATSPTLTTPTLTTPTIANFTSATHTHANAANGGQLSGLTALINSTVSADKLNIGPGFAQVETTESTASTSYTDLATPGPSVTVTIGVNGIALIILTSLQFNSAGGTCVMGYSASGANTIAESDFKSAQLTGTNTNSATFVFLETGLAPGSTTFKLRYRTTSNTSSFVARKLVVVPL